MVKTRNHSEDRVAKDSYSKAAHDTKRRGSSARPTRSRKAMYWESVALMSIGVADYEKDGRTWWLIDSPRSENKSMFLQCFMSRRDVVIGNA